MMNVSFNSLSKSSIKSILQNFTSEQIYVAKLALSVIALVSLVFLTVWLEGRFRRTVTVIKPNGDTHRSLIEKVNGKAKVIYDSFLASGAILEGEFTNGKMNGPGKVTLNYAKIKDMEGEFCNDEFIKGKITYLDGKIEEGEFELGKLVKGKTTDPLKKNQIELRI